MVLSVGLGTGYAYVAKNIPNWIPLIDVENLSSPKNIADMSYKLNELGYNVIVSDSDEIRKELKNKNISFTRVIKSNPNETTKVSVGKNFVLKEDKFLKDFLEILN